MRAALIGLLAIVYTLYRNPLLAHRATVTYLQWRGRR